MADERSFEDARYADLCQNGLGTSEFELLAYTLGHMRGKREALACAEVAEIASQLRSIIETGKRDMTNPKYDSMFSKEALAAFEKLSKGGSGEA